MLKINNNSEYFTLEHWYTTLGTTFVIEVIYVCLIPIGILGILLNVFALLVLRSDKFTLPFYTYLRVYTINSILICFINGTQFSIGVRRIITSTNSRFSMLYFCYVYAPAVLLLNLYGSSLDVILSMERVSLLSKRMLWFRELKPRKVCLTLAIIFVMIALPYWFFFKPMETVVYLNETTPFQLHFFNLDYDNIFASFYFQKLPYFSDIPPIFFETTCNFLLIFLIKKYVKRKLELSVVKKSEDTPMIKLLSSSRSDKNANNNAILNNTTTRSRRMEVKLTILVIFLSTLSTM
jgi:hypothetical protein